MKYKELSANTVAFISYRCRLTKVLAGDTRGKWSINLYLNPVNFPASTLDSLTWPPPPLLPFFPLVAPANTGVSLPLQLMKATVLTESYILSIFIVICLLQRCLLTVAR